jgi:hypothetical protein
MSKLVNSKLSYVLILTCCLVAIADFVTTWMALTFNPIATEQGIMAARAMDFGGFSALLAADILFVGLLACAAYWIYGRYRSNLATMLLLGPYICMGIFASVNNWNIAI